MALIRQIKVGGTTYDIGVKAGDGIAISTSGAVEVRCSSGLRADASGLSVLLSGNGHGLEFKDGAIAVKLASGLYFDSKGEIAPFLGSGLHMNDKGQIAPLLGSGLRINDNGEIALI
jgi:hypothetical protein